MGRIDAAYQRRQHDKLQGVGRLGTVLHLIEQPSQAGVGLVRSGILVVFVGRLLIVGGTSAQERCQCPALAPQKQQQAGRDDRQGPARGM